MCIPNPNTRIRAQKVLKKFGPNTCIRGCNTGDISPGPFFIFSLGQETTVARAAAPRAAGRGRARALAQARLSHVSARLPGARPSSARRLAEVRFRLGSPRPCGPTDCTWLQCRSVTVTPQCHSDARLWQVRCLAARGVPPGTWRVTLTPQCLRDARGVTPVASRQGRHASGVTPRPAAVRPPPQGLGSPAVLDVVADCLQQPAVGPPPPPSRRGPVAAPS